MVTAMDEYIPLDARVNYDGTIDVLVDGAALPGSTGLARDAVLDLLCRYAGDNGKVLMTTTHPNGRITRDVISENGDVTPFYVDVPENPVRVGDGVPEPDRFDDALLHILHRAGSRRVTLPEASSLQAPETTAPAKARVKLGEGSIPKYDVEADIMKALAVKSAPPSRTRVLVTVIAVTVMSLAGLGAAGWFLLAGG